jgi:protocatechuate 3,4-dioxygenase beta subunit
MRIMIFVILLCAFEPALAQDTTPPVLNSVAITPSVLNVSTAAQEIAVRFAVTDIGGSGVAHVFVDFLDPDGKYFSADSDIQRISGDEFDGVYEYKGTIPQFAKPGGWTVNVDLRDKGNNYIYYSRGAFDEPFPNLDDASFTIINSGIVDTDPPVLDSVSITPKLVDVARGAQITVLLAVSDPGGSGVKDVFVDLLDPDGEFFFSNSVAQRISGDGLEGVYEFKETIPQQFKPGEWNLRVILGDGIGRSIYGPLGLPFPNPEDTKFTVGDVVSDEIPTISRLQFQSDTRTFRITFASQPNRDYDAEASTDLSVFSRILSVKGADGQTETTVDVESSGQMSIFYRINPR